ncbi:mitogen-activated protein kinase-activated protein kinase 5 [Camelus ferus]|nr:mitogen-activated protein kinase-activated protein kinase 5 [Camelus ferus]
MSEGSDMEKAIKETSILEEYNINWTQKLGAGISGPVRVCVKKSTQERFALKILLDRPKARNEDAPVKLCDFGFAKIDQGDLMTPQFTPYYVAPQVLEAQRRHQKEKSGIIPTSPTPYTYNKSCDLWSLGVIIYVMLCGYPPFYSKHHSRTIPKDMRRKIMTGSFEFPEEEWSQISEMAKDVVRKLLKVKPEERLTIEGVLDHPWLNSTEALDNVLPSAQLMMDKAVVAGIQQAHAEQLANMRIQDLKVSLKPLHSVNNPILRKRKLLGTKPKDGVYIHDRENGAEDSNVALEKLRDVIAQCILPQAGENEDEKLNEVVQEAWKYNRECKLLRDTLQSFSWNGRGFTDKVDRLKLAEIQKRDLSLTPKPGTSHVRFGMLLLLVLVFLPSLYGDLGSVYYSSYEIVIPKSLTVEGREDPVEKVSYMLFMQGQKQLIHLTVKRDYFLNSFPVFSYHSGILGQEMSHCVL